MGSAGNSGGLGCNFFKAAFLIYSWLWMIRECFDFSPGNFVIMPINSHSKILKLICSVCCLQNKYYRQSLLIARLSGHFVLGDYESALLSPAERMLMEHKGNMNIASGVVQRLSFTYTCCLFGQETYIKIFITRNIHKEHKETDTEFCSKSLWAEGHKKV